MGLGIAHVCAASNYDVMLVDIDSAALDRAMSVIDKNLGRLVSNGEISDVDRLAALNKISMATSFDALNDSDLVIEAATETEEIKTAIYSQVCPILKDEAILSTNTSSISITRLAAHTDRPGRFLGIHFMNPAPRMELIELIRGIATEPEIFDAAFGFATKLGKTPVIAEDIYPYEAVSRTESRHTG